MNYNKLIRSLFLRKQSYIFYSILLLTAFNPIYATSKPKDNSDRETVIAMIERLMPGKSNLFILKNIPGNGSDSFHIQSQNKKILIEGTNALSMAKGLSYYLKTYCHTTVSWYANQPIEVPRILPEVTNPMGERCRFENRFFMNYCTAGYTTLG
ncbi:MAG: alpha-N-acetylglucosaminidase N-terminal domain-containing protein [Ginsengibacter sp.]